MPVKICNGRRLGRRPQHGTSQRLAKQPSSGRKEEWRIEGIWALDPESEKVSREARTEPVERVAIDQKGSSLVLSVTQALINTM